MHHVPLLSGIPVSSCYLLIKSRIFFCIKYALAYSSYKLHSSMLLTCLRDYPTIKTMMIRCGYTGLVGYTAVCNRHGMINTKFIKYDIKTMTCTRLRVVGKNSIFPTTITIFMLRRKRYAHTPITVSV